MTEAELLQRLRLDVAPECDATAAPLRRRRVWPQLLADWRSTFEQLHSFMSSLDEGHAASRTMCDRWTQKDLVAHHIKGDALTLESFTGGNGFDFRTLDDGPQRSRADDFIAEFRPVPLHDLLHQWRTGHEALFRHCASLDGAAVHERVTWAAVPVSRIALVQARLSETWIHGWDSRWPLEAATPFDDRCYWVADLASRTTVPYGLDKAEHAGEAGVSGRVLLRLTGPAGGFWERRRGDVEQPVHMVEGPAWAWLALASRRWSEHYGWRVEGPAVQEALLRLFGPKDAGVRGVLRAARAFV